MANESQAGNEVEPVSKFGDELTGKKIAEVSVPLDQLFVSERFHEGKYEL